MILEKEGIDNMNNLIDVINDHRNDINNDICDKLIDIINNYNINNEDELKHLEDGFFTTNNLHERNETKYQAYRLDPTHLEELNQNEISKLENYSDAYNAATNELLKTKYLILIYELLGWNFVFPYTAYILIKESRL